MSYFHLGASAEPTGLGGADAPEPDKQSPSSGRHPSRYSVGEVPIRNTYAAVFDAARDGECFCLIDPDECVGGLSTALARAKDIAEMFNKASTK